MVSRFIDKIADILSHPKTTQILGVIKFLKSPKGFWSVVFLPATYIISQLTQLSKADVAQRHIEQSEYFIEKLFWQIAEIFLVSDSYFGLVIAICFVAVFSILHYYEIKKAPSNNQQVDFFVKELGKKNQEIDELKAKQRETISESDRIALTRVIIKLQTELDKYKEETKPVKDAIAKAKNIKVAEEATEILNTSGIDAALEYFESIDFDAHLQQSIEYSKAILIQAGLYALNNDHIKANKTYQKSIELNRNFDNSLAYANYLTDQHRHKEAIIQLQLIMHILNISNEKKSRILNNLANLYQNQNRAPLKTLTVVP